MFGSAKGEYDARSHCMQIRSYLVMDLRNKTNVTVLLLLSKLGVVVVVDRASLHSRREQADYTSWPPRARCLLLDTESQRSPWLEGPFLARDYSGHPPSLCYIIRLTAPIALRHHGSNTLLKEGMVFVSFLYLDQPGMFYE